ncbi:Norsolorinic acid ketoreductase [Podospora fimiseda]|uniref:Norsolorinic acid ketoreductase n=1 Tax=Podospora fimiseda TaxID=252190 RepID=A0AAN7BS93_9PEZI|nr:Norsolorinic acid ketoreductase [Podospora fimiseda]
MADNTVYLITGANRGIGLALTTLLLTRPKTTVIATSRTLPSPSSPYSSIPIHPTSILIPILLDDSNNSDDISSSTLSARVLEAGISHINIVIANAGSSAGFKTIKETEIDDYRQDLEVNLFGVIKLFKGVWKNLLEKTTENKKFIVISSSVGSIDMLGKGEGELPVGGYGLSKAAINWWAQKLSAEYKSKGLLVGVIHPGWVKTAMGQGLADAVGVKEPPLTTEESAKGILEQIDGLTEEKTHQFLMYDGRVLPW